MLDVAQCRILHSRSNDQMDSYVLRYKKSSLFLFNQFFSESSMFVSDQRLILKTCGGTRLLDALPHILQLAERYGGFTTVSNVYYSRKNFLRPFLQPDPHKSFNDEVDILTMFFPHGEAYCMGPINSTDCWYLFAINQRGPISKRIDHTLEIQMTELPSEVLNIYTKEACETGRACTRKSGLIDLLPPESIIHEELFEPVGYSMNALIGQTDEYVSVHVTPEPAFTYVSFETNQSNECLYKQTLNILKCFKPRKFIMTLFTNKESNNGKKSQQRLWNEEISGYRRNALQFVRLAVSSVQFNSYICLLE
jgi:S-adenosylmethionine decarboxylase